MENKMQKLIQVLVRSGFNHSCGIRGITDTKAGKIIVYTDRPAASVLVGLASVVPAVRLVDSLIIEYGEEKFTVESDNGSEFVLSKI